MLILPDSLTISRAKGAEESLLKATHKWLGQDKRDPRMHVSDLLDPRQAYWQRKKPKPLSDKLAVMFLIGKVLHAFVIAAVDGVSGKDLASDEGSKYSKELEVAYSIDKLVKGIPREIKTTRTYYIPKTIKDLALYCEQLLCYMVAEKKNKGQLWLLLLNTKDSGTGRTSPQYRCYTIKVSDADLKRYKRSMKEARAAIQHALDTDKPQNLPLCRRFKCGEKNCDWWKNCKPEGRYGIANQRDWTDIEKDLVVR